MSREKTYLVSSDAGTMVGRFSRSQGRRAQLDITVELLQVTLPGAKGRGHIAL